MAADEVRVEHVLNAIREIETLAAAVRRAVPGTPPDLKPIENFVGAVRRAVEGRAPKDVLVQAADYPKWVGPLPPRPVPSPFADACTEREIRKR